MRLFSRRAPRGLIQEEIGGTIIHNKLDGLMWQMEPPAKMDWSDAVKYSRNLRLCGYDDWQLPTINELELIFSELKLTEPAEIKKGPVPDSYYWRKNGIPDDKDVFPVFWSHSKFEDLEEAMNILYIHDNRAIRLINLKAYPICVRRVWESF